MTIAIRHYIPEEDDYQIEIHREINWIKIEKNWIILFFDRGTEMDLKAKSNGGMFYIGFDQKLDEITIV